MGKKIEVNLSNKSFYSIVLVLALLLIATGVYAYGTSNPSVMGHTLGEIDGWDWIGGRNMWVFSDQKVGIGDITSGNPPTNLNADFTVLGSVGANEFCTVTGSNCKTIFELSSSSGGDLGYEIQVLEGTSSSASAGYGYHKLPSGFTQSNAVILSVSISPSQNRWYPIDNSYDGDGECTYSLRENSQGSGDYLALGYCTSSLRGKPFKASLMKVD